MTTLSPVFTFLEADAGTKASPSSIIASVLYMLNPGLLSLLINLSLSIMVFMSSSSSGKVTSLDPKLDLMCPSRLTLINVGSTAIAFPYTFSPRRQN